MTSLTDYNEGYSTSTQHALIWAIVASLCETKATMLEAFRWHGPSTRSQEC